MQPVPVIRPACDADDAEVARLIAANAPESPCTGAEVAAARDARRDRFHLRLVAVRGDRLAGFGLLEVPAAAAAPGRLRVCIMVDPGCQTEGIGARLHAELEAEARQRGARELLTETLASHPRAVRFASERGYTVYNTRVERRLRLADVDTEAIGRGLCELVDRFFDARLRVASYRQLAQAFDDAPQRLYRLFVELWRDMPTGIAGTDPTAETYIAAELGDPAFLAGGSFVVLDDRDWIAMCTQSVAGFSVLTSMTGVVRQWRGRGLARWLKLHSIAYALDAGAHEIRACNDAANAPMIALNRALGFVAVATELRLRKELQ